MASCAGIYAEIATLQALIPLFARDSSAQADYLRKVRWPVPRRSKFEMQNERRAEQLDREIAIRIRWAREAIPYGMVEFAEKVGMERSQYSKIESATHSPSTYALAVFCHELRVSADYLLFGSLLPSLGDETVKLRLAALHPSLMRGEAPTDTSQSDTGAVVNTPRKRGPKPKHEGLWYPKEPKKSQS